MGKRFRNRRDATINAIVGADDVVVNHERLDTDVQYQVEGFSSGALGKWYQPAFPGQRETVHTEAEGRPSGRLSGVGSVRDDSVSGPGREVGGQPGLVDGVPYSLGVVSSDLVENFALTGQQAIIRRQANPGGNTGPVGTSDHNMLLALAYEQQVNQFYPNEASQADLVRAV